MNDEDTRLRNLGGDLRNEAEDHLKEVPRETFDRYTEDLPAFKESKTYTDFERGMQKRKSKKLPKIPKTIVEMLEALDNGGQLAEYYNGSVKVLNSDTTAGVIFSHPALRAGFQAGLEMTYDGTFYTCPLLFRQLFIVMFEHKGHFFPGFVVPMTGASYNHYKPVFDEIKRLCGGDLNFERSMGDFELASGNAVCDVFHGIDCKHCFFHFAQAILRNIKQKGLAKKYKQKTFRAWVRKVMCLPLLPHEEIQEAWNELRRTGINFPNFKRTDRGNLARFKLYVDSQWMNNNNFSHEELSVFRLENATNNAQECLNGIIKKLIKQKRPNIWRFLLILKSIFKAKASDFNRLNNGLELKQDRETVSDLVKEARRTSEDKLLNEDLDFNRMDFLEEVSTSHAEIVRGLRASVLPEVEEENSEDEEVPETQTQDPLDVNQNARPLCPLCQNEPETMWGFLHHGPTGYQNHAGYCQVCANLDDYRPGQPCPRPGCQVTILAAMPCAIGS